VKDETRAVRWIFHGPVDADMFYAAQHMIAKADWSDDRIAVRWQGKFYSCRRNKSGSYTVRRND
jgi:hypothetical protein